MLSFFAVIPIVGIILSALIYSSIIAAVYAMGYWRILFRGSENYDSVYSLVGPGESHCVGLIAPTSIPLVFLWVWFAFLVDAFYNN